MRITSQIIDEIPTAEVLEQRLKNSDKEQLLYFWTPIEVELLRQYAPSTFARVSGKDTESSLEQVAQRLIVQAQSELINRQSILDAGILAGKRNTETVRQHFKNLNTTINLFNLLTANSQSAEYYLGLEDLDAELIEIKLKYTEILRDMPEWLSPVQTVRKNAENSVTDRFGYVDEVLTKLDGLVTGIVLYGSASREEDPNKVSDYDNYLIVEDNSLEKVYEILKGHRFQPAKDGKPVGYNIIEKSSFAKMLRMNHDPQESIKHCKVLFGEADFPLVSDEEVKQRGLSYAVLRSKALKSSAAWQVSTPGFVQGIPDLFNYFQKTQLFMIQAGLNWRDGIQARNKDDFVRVLSDLGGEVAPYNEDIGYTTTAMCRAAVTASKIAERFMKGAKFGDIPINFDNTEFNPKLIEEYDSLAIQFLGYH
jgi:hypothetical protein